MKKDNIIAIIFAAFALPIIFIWFLPALCSPIRYPNRDIINKYTYQYSKHKNVLSEIARCLAEANVPEEVSLHYNVNNTKKFDINVNYSYLAEKSCLQHNTYFFKDYFYDVSCYKGFVRFSRGQRNINNQGCSLVNCPDPEEYYPNCTIYSNGNYPKDTDANCMYHIEGDWYVRLP